MKVLLSIKPEYAEKILNGQKHFEFRKSIPRSPGIKTVVIYATLPVGKVLGEFDIEEVLSAAPSHLWTLTSKKAGIPRSFFQEYFKGRTVAYAIRVREARRYEKPLSLKSVLHGRSAPQSFCYL
jgi:predicted transcriptional regulator